jgi:hypothetical protein
MFRGYKVWLIITIGTYCTNLEAAFSVLLY